MDGKGRHKQIYNLLNVPFYTEGTEPGADSGFSWISNDKLAIRDGKEAAWSETVHQKSQGTDSQAQDAGCCISKLSMFVCVWAGDAKWFYRQVISIPAKKEVKNASAIETTSCEMKILEEKAINSTVSWKETLS